MNDTEKAKKIIETMRTLEEREQVLFLHGLLGLVKIDSPRSIVDAAGWSLNETLASLQKSLDANA